MNDELSTENLVKQYLNICNDILLKQRDTTPYKEIISLIKQALDQYETIILRIINDEDKTLGIYTTQFIADQFKPIGVPNSESPTTFVISQNYLKEVIDNADYYAEHPLALNWDWLKIYLTQKSGK